VTNYFFETDFPDDEEGLRKRGVSKEHRVDPIAAMGLFMDCNGLPVGMSIFPGNTSDLLTLQPTMKDIKESYDLGRIAVVADKGMNSSKNIDAVVNAGDGFVFSQILRGKKGRYNSQLFDLDGWTSNESETYRYKTFVEEYTKENIIDKATGEVLGNTAKFRSVDMEKAEKDAMYDGYFCIIT
jgi:transposase